MTGYRQSMVFALEDKFGEGPGDNDWIAPPPGTQFESTHSRNVNTFTAMGTKTWELAAYGQFQGQWSWSFILDYDYLEPLYLAFDNYTFISRTGKPGIHRFSKCNAKRVKSFCIRRKILNKVAGGSMDEAEILVGCVVSNIAFSRSAGGGSQIQVKMSGQYAYETMDNTDLDATDYTAYSGSPVEYACLFIGDEAEDTHVDFVDSASISIANGVSMAYGICTAFPRIHSEGKTTYSINISAYSNDPKRFKKRLYSGGYENRASQPWAKNMKPMQKLTMISFDKSMYNEYDYTPAGAQEPIFGPRYNTMMDAYEASEKTVKFTILNAIIKSLTWQSGDGSKLMDELSSTNASKIVLDITNVGINEGLDLKKGGNHPLPEREDPFDPCKEVIGSPSDPDPAPGEGDDDAGGA